MATRMAAIVEKKGEETFVGDVTKEDGTVVQEEQTREIFGAKDGAIEKVDDLTVRLNLPTPDITIIANFCDYPALIVHRGFEEAGGDLTAAPVGTGPWELVGMEVGVRAEYQRRTDGTVVGRVRGGHGAGLPRRRRVHRLRHRPLGDDRRLRGGRDPHRLRDAAELCRDLRRARACRSRRPRTANTLADADERDPAAVRRPAGPERRAARRRQRDRARPRLPGPRRGRRQPPRRRRSTPSTSSSRPLPATRRRRWRC